MSISKTPLSERPRERCLAEGAQALSLRECLAILIGSGPKQVGCMGVADALLKKPGADLEKTLEEEAFFNGLEGTGSSYLKNIYGLGPSSQAKILAAFELARRYQLFREELRNNAHQKNKLQLSKLQKQSLQKIPKRKRAETKEWLGFVPVLRTGKCGELCVVEQGVRTHVNTDTGELFARVLALRPLGFFLVHNHPSGDVTPSTEDKHLTQTVSFLAETLNVPLLGHWVVSVGAEVLF